VLAAIGPFVTGASATLDVAARFPEGHCGYHRRGCPPALAAALADRPVPEQERPLEDGFCGMFSRVFAGFAAPADVFQVSVRLTRGPRRP
jgi:hypothetical protein